MLTSELQKLRTEAKKLRQDNAVKNNHALAHYSSQVKITKNTSVVI